MDGDSLSGGAAAGRVLGCVRLRDGWALGCTHRTLPGGNTCEIPRLAIADVLPGWMDVHDLQRRRETPLWLEDEPPQGLLRVLVADRGRD